MSVRPTANRWRPHVLALGVYALLALVVTYPMPLRLLDSIAANQPGSVDGFLGIWNIWWTARALTGLRDPFFTPLLFHPQGLDLFWQTLSLPQGLLALPVTLALGPLPAYNLLILASFVLGGYAAFLFVRYVTGSAPAALVGGAVYALAPFHLQKVIDGQLEVASIQWVPLYLLALHALLDRPRPWLALLSGLLLLWVGLGTWYYGLFCLIYTGATALLWAIGNAEVGNNARRMRARSVAFSLQPSAFSLQRFAWGCSPVLIWLVLMAPRLYSLALTGDRLLGDARQFNESSSADLVAFFLPSPLHPLWGAAVTDFYLQTHPGASLWNVSLGLVAIALALASLLPPRSPRISAIGEEEQESTNLTTHDSRLTTRDSRLETHDSRLTTRDSRHGRGVWRWWTLLGVTMILAMGEELQVVGVNTGVPLPFALLADLPGIRSSHRPNHFVILSILLVALLAARGFLRLVERATVAASPPPGAGRGGQGVGAFQRPAWLAACLAVAVVLAVDGWAGPLPLVTRSIPAGYAQLPPGDEALLPIPVNLNVSRSENLWYQTAHGRPIVGGFIGREPPYPMGRYAPGVRELRYGRRDSPDILTPGWPEVARESLDYYGIRHVLFHPDAMKETAAPLRALAAEMGLAATYADERLEIYPVPATPTPRPFAYLGRGWGGVERDGERTWRWMGERAELYLVNPFDAPRVVRVELQMESFEQPRPLAIQLGDGPPATVEVSRAAVRRTFSLLLPPGTNVVYLSAPAAPRPGRGAEQISISFERITVR